MSLVLQLVVEWCAISAYSGTLIPDPHRTPTSSPCSEFVYMFSSSYSCKCVIRCPEWLYTFVSCIDSQYRKILTATFTSKMATNSGSQGSQCFRRSSLFLIWIETSLHYHWELDFLVSVPPIHSSYNADQCPCPWWSIVGRVPGKRAVRWWWPRGQFTPRDWTLISPLPD